MSDLAGKVVAITKAASGIGKACAKACLEAGARVALVDRDKDALTTVCESLGLQAVPVATGLLDPGSVAQMHPKILGAAGRLDVFHTDAGAYVGGDMQEADRVVFMLTRPPHVTLRDLVLLPNAAHL